MDKNTNIIPQQFIDKKFIVNFSKLRRIFQLSILHDLSTIEFHILSIQFILFYIIPPDRILRNSLLPRNIYYLAMEDEVSTNLW